jgi:glucose/arabinose dehydrogenase
MQPCARIPHANLRLTRRSVLLFSLLLPACNVGIQRWESGPPTATPPPAASRTPSPVRTPSSASPSLATVTAPRPSPTGAPSSTGPVALRVETLLTGLEAPWEVTFAPDGRLLLTERPGRVRLVVNGQLRTQPALTLPVAAVGEGGLLGLALHPDFSRTGWVYLYYTYQTDQLWNRVVRYRLADDQSSSTASPAPACTTVAGSPSGRTASCTSPPATRATRRWRRIWAPWPARSSG